MRNLLWAGVFFCGLCAAQEHQEIIVWEQGSPCCKTLFENGIPHERYINGKMLIEVYAPEAVDKKTEKVHVVVYNGQESNVDLDVDPARMAASADDPAKTILESTDADALIAKERRSSGRMGIIGAALQGVGAGMQNHTATVNNSDGSTSTVTYHDPNDDQVARQNAANQAAVNRGRYSSLSGTVLRHNTVLKGKSVEGDVYFLRPKGLDKKIPLSAIAINLGEVTYIFPFDKGKILLEARTTTK